MKKISIAGAQELVNILMFKKVRDYVNFWGGEPSPEKMVSMATEVMEVFDEYCQAENISLM